MCFIQSRIKLDNWLMVAGGDPSSRMGFAAAIRPCLSALSRPSVRRPDLPPRLAHHHWAFTIIEAGRMRSRLRRYLLNSDIRCDFINRVCRTLTNGLTFHACATCFRFNDGPRCSPEVVALHISTNPRRGRLRACFHFDAFNVSLVLFDGGRR